MRSRHTLFVAFLIVLFIPRVLAQSPNGTISGLVVDPTGAVVVEADVLAANDATGVQYSAKTNEDGIYVVSNLPPGTYRLQVSKIGFKTLIKPDIVLNVEDALAINFNLPIGAVSETVTVSGGASPVDTQDGAVSTVVDRQFAENLPMNGRSFQTLIQLTPGVVSVVSNTQDSGQFSINGQRAASNYWMVDGVSANIGISPFIAGNGFGGTLGSFSALGGTNSLVSIDAMQEFRIETSTYAPEFGRAPGGQISIVTRSGTNEFHGTAFDYLRNDIFDANNWFNVHVPPGTAPLPKAKERQNDFGGTLGGPILKGETFFFFSYEGLRLRLPQTAHDFVPDTAAREAALPAVQPFLNAYPLPNGPAGTDNLATGIAQFNASFSNPATLDAYSLRIDHTIKDKLNLFGRYNYSPSDLIQRGAALSSPLSVLFASPITTQTATVGFTLLISPAVTNDLRVNYSRTGARSFYSMDDFGGAVPLTSLPFPSPFTASNASFQFEPLSLFSGSSIFVGANASDAQRQFNIVDNLSVQKGAHGLKFGVDFRRLSPQYVPAAYSQDILPLDVPSAEAGLFLLSVVQADLGAHFLFRNLSVFAQDTWRVRPRLTATYGVRWDVDFVPSTTSGPSFPAVTGFNFNDLSQLALAPAGTPPFHTTYGNFAPRLGVAYQISQSQAWQTVLRGGFGVFYDLVSSETGSLTAQASYPFLAKNVSFFGTFPLSPSAAVPPPITPASIGPPYGELVGFDPHLQLPYTLEWNVALEQTLGNQQTVTISYLGAAGRRLLQGEFVTSPNPAIGFSDLVGNVAYSNYDALQIEFQRRLSHGLQALASYSWSHSTDTASAGSALGNRANGLVPGVNLNTNLGPSDFDIRNAFSAGVTYDIPVPKSTSFTKAILEGWSLENVIQARSAPPVNIYYSGLGVGLFSNVQVRPDVVPGVPFYLFGSQYPGGKAFNPAAFTPPPLNPVTLIPLSQGDLSRNALRGFGAAQWDFAVHRDFPFRESVKLQFRAEMFNVLNHTNFGQPVGDLGSPTSPNPQFGLSTQTLAQSLNGNNVGGGAFSPLYQIGGPRSIQFALKLMF